MKRSKHSLSNYVKQSQNMGDLVPIGLTEVLPGDSIDHAISAFIRFSPLLTPLMHDVQVKIHSWFVPHRLVWNDWENFITGGPDGDSVPVFPTVNLPSVAESTLANYLGVPIVPGALEVSALPFRGYALIFNEWYRDQDLVDPVVISRASGADTTTNRDLLVAAWEKDYFTSARPFEQKGPEVTIPLAGTAPVVTTDEQVQIKVGAAQSTQNLRANPATYPRLYPEAGTYTTSDKVAFGPQTGLEADLSDVPAVSVNDLRLAMALQRYEEARARYGSRYVEYLRYLGVKSSDARLQRPEYLGGGKQHVQFSEVLQTAEGSDPVGQMRGHGLAAMRSNRYRRFFEEHGYIFSFMIVRPRAVYADGLFRTWNRRTKEDFFQKELQHIGQQEVLNKEVYAKGAQPDGVFGYQDRYDEYRRGESRVAGEFATSLKSWNLARLFGAAPSLNDDFVTCIPRNDIFAETTSDQLYCMIKHQMRARRIIAKTGTSFIY